MKRILLDHGMRRLRVGVLCFCALILLDGCRHKQLAPQLPPVVLTPDVPPPPPTSPPMKSPVPESVDTPPSVTVTQVKPKRTPKKAPKPVAVEPPQPVETASAGAPTPASTVGELSTGGEANPQKQQDAAELIVSSERRLDLLSKSTAGQQETQIRQVRNFLRQAKEALSTGDAEGAKTLATKAKVLMDDLTK